LVDRGQGPEVLLEAVAHATMGANVSLTSDGLSFSSVQSPVMRFDVIGEPLVELGDRRVEVLLTLLLSTMIPQTINEVDVIPVPPLHQLTVFNTQPYRDGPTLDHIPATADITR